MTDPAPHLDLDALADALAAKDAEPADAPEAADRAHLASCRSCTSRLAELQAAEARVVSALAGLATPPVPADVVDRLRAALAAEGPLEPARPGPSSGGATVTPMPAQRLRRRWLPAAAAAVLMISGGGLGFVLLDRSTGSDSVADSAAGSGGESVVDADLPRSSSGIDWSDTAAVQTALPALLSGEVVGTSLRAEAGAAVAGSTDAAAPALPPPDPRSSGPVADEAPVPAQGQPGQAAPNAAEAAPDPLERLRSPEGLDGCLSVLLSQEERAAGVRPEALDYALFKGQPALAVLLPDPDPARVAVFVVGPTCGPSDEAVLAYVRVARP